MNYKEIRENSREGKWRELEEHIGGDIGREIVLALKDFYSIFDDSVIDWYADLYDVETGAFYYSPSAKSNETVEWHGRTAPLLPDAESTCQAFGFISNSGMADHVGKDYMNILPDWVCESFTNYIRSMQHPGGYFYHPQWGKEWVDTRINRRERDLYWCSGWLRRVGAKPIYDTPDGLEGERRATASADAVIKKVGVEIPEHLRSREAFLEYLSHLDMKNRSYHDGNELTTQTGTLLQRDRELEAEGADYRFMILLTDWLASTMNPVTGHWQEKSDYYGVNGFLKAGSIFTAAGRRMPYPEAAARSAIDAITSDEPLTSVTDIYNTWFALNCIFENLRRYGGDEGSDIISRLRGEILSSLPRAIRASKEKVLVFKKAGGAFSYCPDMSSPTSQDMPVAIYGTPEGDINATGIAINGVLNQMFMTLGLEEYKPPVFCHADAERYMSLLEEKRKKYIKNAKLA